MAGIFESMIQQNPNGTFQLALPTTPLNPMIAGKLVLAGYSVLWVRLIGHCQQARHINPCRLRIASKARIIRRHSKWIVKT